MNLFRKLALTLLCAIGFAGFCAQAGASNFNLTAFINSNETAQVQMLSALLQDNTVSNAEIAHVLEVEVKAVENTRKYFGPLELDQLLRSVKGEYRIRCWEQFRQDFNVELLLVGTACSVVILSIALNIVNMRHRLPLRTIFPFLF